MTNYEAAIAREAGLRNHKPLFYYDYKVVPVSKNAKYSFALALYDRSKNRIPLYSVDITKTYTNFDDPVFSGKADFFHEKEHENEAKFKERIKVLAEFNMTQRGIPGFASNLLSFGFTEISKKNSGPHRIIEGEDYIVEISERKYYEYEPEMTFSDIKVL